MRYSHVNASDSMKHALCLFVLCCTAFASGRQSTPKKAKAAPTNPQILRVAVAGSEPFVVKGNSGLEGISVEIWQAAAAMAGWRYRFQMYGSVPEALAAVTAGDADLVVGPVSITAERAQRVRFTEPYFGSSLSILSRTDAPTIWERIEPFFSKSFFWAVAVLSFILALVGTLIWLAERDESSEQFPRKAAPGIANGIWLAIVTMTTVGYGDKAPRTVWGRLLTAIWMIVSIVTATSLVAGIASTLTLTGMKTTTISSTSQLSGKSVAVLENSPGQVLAQDYRARPRPVESIRQGYELVKQKRVDAFIFDRPQLLYLLQQEHDSDLAISKSEYMHQGYGFAAPLRSLVVHDLNVTLLRLQESGRVRRIIRVWLGEAEE